MPYKMKKGAAAMHGPKAMMMKKGATAMKEGATAMKRGATAMYGKGPMAVHMSKVQPHKKGGVTAMYDGPKAMKQGPTATPTQKAIKGLGSSNKSGGKYI